ncbi:ABC transporter ATP-binding protein [Amorphus orientalis]|uniref:ATP-binding cassette subfamily B multidrug efflux pump n=1 Tax=Amorphus orientalis TaxID=649198 RepID=A0AAE3VS44_9HYPH|nr:ABC transporter ATP-binding protein [Amorphus orientalis]MDQ0316641.1 ATP-binding cassette subfamily B multidrug efflux pump [Amorphus orientalis]
MFSRFESLVDPLAPGPEGQPPAQLGAFVWHFVRQSWKVIAVLLVVAGVVALIEVSLFDFIGRIVDMLADTPPGDLFAVHGTTLLWMGLVAVVVRPLAATLHLMLVHQAVEPGLTNLVRWQTHRYVLRQSLSFFQNDFAGRLANRIIQTGPSLREAVVSLIDAIWYVTVYTGSALFLFAQADVWLTVPLLFWIAAYVGVLGYFVPRVKRQATIMSEARSMLTGRVVDSYTNIMTVKLFAHAEREDAYAREAVVDHTAKFRRAMRYVTGMNIALVIINGLLIAGTLGIALWLWHGGAVTIGAIALAAGLVMRINAMSGWIMWVTTGIFENLGTVTEGMGSIARPYSVVDRADSKRLAVPEGEIRYEGVSFHYGQDRGVIDRLDLTVAPGERVGLVGRSGAGKSTLVNLLLRFHDVEAGRILVDGQDIAAVSQESLRAAIGMVTQDTSLLHRSVRDNVRYGRPDADDAAIWAALRQAHADGFVPDLVDLSGRTGLDAHVGERGVKLSGGQRQRIAIARVLLKNAPILILDEATSALDSEIESAIQEDLESLMQDKTVIAIAHRLSTIARMDRLVVMDAGRIVETGTHAELIARNGIYARLWARQSGGFLGEIEQDPAQVLGP